VVPGAGDDIVKPLQTGALSCDSNPTINNFTLWNGVDWTINNNAASARTLNVTSNMLIRMNSISGYARFLRGAKPLTINIGGELDIRSGIIVFGDNGATGALNVSGLTRVDTTLAGGLQAQLRFGKYLGGVNNPYLNGGLYLMASSDKKVFVSVAESDQIGTLTTAFLWGGNEYTYVQDNVASKWSGYNGTSTLAVNGDTGATHSFGGIIQDVFQTGGNNVRKLALVKSGSNVQILTGTNTYSGGTSVEGGTLIIDGVHSSTTAVNIVASGAAIGGSGTLGGDLVLSNGAQVVFSTTDTLTVDGSSVDLGSLAITDLVGLDSSVANGTYTLMDGTATFDFTDVQHLGSANAYFLGDGKSAYFQEGSLQVVVAGAIASPADVTLEYTTGGALEIGSTNLAIFGTNWLQTTDSLGFPDWSNLYWSVGTTTTNWTVSPDAEHSFYRIINVQ
jgi:fibronectin-binding autotransporter adhesin